MDRIGVRELRQHASRYLERVKKGESLEVTERGKLVALLVPPSAERTAYDDLVAAGVIQPAERPWVWPEPVPGPSISEDLEAVREERL